MRDFALDIFTNVFPVGSKIALANFGSGYDVTVELTAVNNTNRAMLREAIENAPCFGGSPNSENALSQYIDYIEAQRDITREQYIIMFTTNQVSSNTNPCTLASKLQASGIKLITIIQGSTSATFFTCLQDSSTQEILTPNYFNLLLDPFSVYEQIKTVVCPSNPKIELNEIFIDSSTNPTTIWAEFINVGRAFQFTELQLQGALVGPPFSSDTVNQGEIFVLGTLTAANKPCATCKYSQITGGSASLNGWVVRDALNSETLSLYDSSFPSVDLGFSYELKADSNGLPQGSASIGTFWQESCARGGSPGEANTTPCPPICDEAKCRINGDTGATCPSQSASTADCICTAEFFYDSNERSCQDIPNVASCLVYVLDQISNEVTVFWDPVSITGLEGYQVTLPAIVNTQDIQRIPCCNYTTTWTDWQTNQATVKVNALINGNSKTSSGRQCQTDTAPTISPTFDGQTYDPSLAPSPSPTTSANPTTKPTKPPTFAGCGSGLKLDVIFIIDSSGSVTPCNTCYENWFAEIDFVKAIVDPRNQTLPGDSRVGLVNFAGCNSNSNECGDPVKQQECIDSGKIELEFGLNQFGGTPNDLTQVYNYMDNYGIADYKDGWTWTTAALSLAYDEFLLNSPQNNGRTKLIIILTDGRPVPGCQAPCTVNDGPFTLLQNIRAYGIEIIAVGIALTQQVIDGFFTCMVTDSSLFFDVRSFADLSSILGTIGELICSDSIQLIINEIYTDRASIATKGTTITGFDLNFVEIYNPSVGVSVEGFYFEGLLTGTLTGDGTGIAQGDYWVISTYDMNLINQGITGCRGCSQDKLTNQFEKASFLQRQLTYEDWEIGFYNAAGDLLDYVKYDSATFPAVRQLYTFEFIASSLNFAIQSSTIEPEDYNDLGIHWEESCYEYGTPQDPNDEPCPCKPWVCKSRGDQLAQCCPSTATTCVVNQCVCSPNFVLTGNVCVPTFPPPCCYAWIKDDTPNNLGDVEVDWCAPQFAGFEAFKIYLNDLNNPNVTLGSGNSNYILQTDVNLNTCGTNNNCPDIRIQVVYQSSPLIQSDLLPCPVLPPTLAPTNLPTDSPFTQPPTISPSVTPSQNPSITPSLSPSLAPTKSTGFPSVSPTLEVCPELTLEFSNSNPDVVLFDFGLDSDGKDSWQSAQGLGPAHSLAFISNQWVYTDASGSIPASYATSSAISTKFPPLNQAVQWTQIFTGSLVPPTISIRILCKKTNPPGSLQPTKAPIQNICQDKTISIVTTTPRVPFLEGPYTLSNTQLGGGNAYIRSDGTTINYFPALNIWLITNNGATFSYDGPTITDITIPPYGANNWNDWTTGQTISIDIQCQNSTYTPPQCGDIPIAAEFKYLSTPFVGISSTTTNTMATTIPALYAQNYALFNNVPVGSSVNMGFYISDVPIEGTTRFEKTPQPPTSIEAIYHTSGRTIYIDEPIIGYWFQLSDSEGYTTINWENVVVNLEIRGDINVTVPCNLTNIDIIGGFSYNKCIYDATNDIPGLSAAPIAAYLSLRVNGDEVATSPNSNRGITVKKEVLHDGNTEIYGEFTQAPKYPGDYVTCTVYLNRSPVKDVKSFWLSGEFKNDILTFVDFIEPNNFGTITELTGTTNVNSVGRVEIYGSKEVGINDDALSNMLYFGKFVFKVNDQPSSFGEINDVFSVFARSITIDNGYSLDLNDTKGTFIDWRSMGNSNAYDDSVDMVIVQNTPRTLFIGINSLDLFNTAFLNGDDANIDLYPYPVYHDEISTPKQSLSCLDISSAPLVYRSNVNGLLTCQPTVTTSQTGNGSVTIDVAADGVSKTVDINVWYPQINGIVFEGSPEPNTLNEILLPWSGLMSNPFYEQREMNVFASWESGTRSSQTDVIINEFINTITTSNALIATVLNTRNNGANYFSNRFVIKGISDGVVSVNIQRGNTIIYTRTVDVTVTSANPSTIVSGGGYITTHIDYTSDLYSVSTVRDTATQPTTINGTLTRILDYPGKRASIHVSVLLDNTLVIDISDETELRFESLVPTELMVESVDHSGINYNLHSILPAGYATVTPNATGSTSIQQLVSVKFVVPGINQERINAIACLNGDILFDSPINVTAIAECNQNIITAVGDPANYIWGYPTQCTIKVIAYINSATGVIALDVSTDSRTVYTVSGPDNKVFMTGNVINVYSQTTDFGPSQIDISFNDNFLSKAGTRTVNVNVVRFQELTLTTLPYPSNTTNPSNAAQLNQIHCTQSYQSAIFEIFGSLSNGESRDLTSEIVYAKLTETPTPSGSVSLDSDLRLITGLNTNADSTVIATLRENQQASLVFESNNVTFSVTDNRTFITSISLVTFDNSIPKGSWNNVISSTTPVLIRLEFDDGTVIEGTPTTLVNLLPITTISEFMTFSSSNPDIVSIDENGILTLKSNWYTSVNITGTIICSLSLPSRNVSGTEIVYPNLYPKCYDVDIETNVSFISRNGLQFESNSMTTQEINFYIQFDSTCGLNLLSFDFKVWFNNMNFDIAEPFRESLDHTCYAVGEWEGQIFSYNSDTRRGELHLVGIGGSNLDLSQNAINTGYYLVAQCVMNGISDAVTPVIGNIIDIAYEEVVGSTVTTMHKYGVPIVAGSGYQQIGSSMDIVNLTANISSRYNSEIIKDYENVACGEFVYSSQSISSSLVDIYGDTSADCLHTAFDAEVTTYFSYLSSNKDTLDFIQIQEFQKKQMDLPLDYLTYPDSFSNFYRKSCAQATYNEPCPNGLEDAWYNAQVATEKFVVLAVNAREEVYEQYNANFQLSGYAPLKIQVDGNTFKPFTNEDGNVWFELKSPANEEFIKTGLLNTGIGTFIEKTSENTIIIQAVYNASTEYWWFDSNVINESMSSWFVTENGNTTCTELGIIYETYDTRAIELSNTMPDRQYAFDGSSYKGGGDQVYGQNTFIPFTEFCIRESGFTNSPTKSPVPTSSPTEEPTSIPTITPPPDDVAFSCRFEDHGTAIIMTFGTRTNRANFDGEPFDCGAVLTLGTISYIDGDSGDSRCIWKDFQTLRIELGYNFRSLAWKGGIDSITPQVQSQKEYWLELLGQQIRNYEEDSAPAKGRCLILPPCNPPQMKIPNLVNQLPSDEEFNNPRIEGQINLGACDNLELFSGMTKAQAAPVTFTWDANTINSQYASVMDTKLYIPAAQIPAGSHSVSLTAKNYYYPEATVSVTVTKTASTVPYLKILTSKVIDIEIGSDLIIPINAGIDSCDYSTGSTRTAGLTYKWEIETSTGFQFVSDKATLFISNYGSLPIRSTKFCITVSYGSNSVDECVAVNPIILPPLPNGIKRDVIIFSDEILTLNAKDFFDPDSNYFDLSPSVSWECYLLPDSDSSLLPNTYDITNDTKECYVDYDVVNGEIVENIFEIKGYDCFDSNFGPLFNISTEEETIVIVPNLIAEGGHYNISVKITGLPIDSQPTSMENYIEFYYVNPADTNPATSLLPSKLFPTDYGNYPNFEFTKIDFSLNNVNINPNERIVITPLSTEKTATTDNTEYVYSWEIVSENVNTIAYGVDILTTNLFSTESDIILNDEIGDFLFDGERYIFRSTVVRTDNGVKTSYGIGEFEFIANRGPNGGQCSVNSLASTSKYDYDYRVECVGWTDEFIELPLEFNFMILDYCTTNNDCQECIEGNCREWICDDTNVCRAETGVAVDSYLKDWSQASTFEFTLATFIPETKVLRSFIRDVHGYVSTYDTIFTPTNIGSQIGNGWGDPEGIVSGYINEELLPSIENAKNSSDLTGLLKYTVALDNILDKSVGLPSNFDRELVVPYIIGLYDTLKSDTANGVNGQINHDRSDLFNMIMTQLYNNGLQFIDESTDGYIEAESRRIIRDMCIDIESMKNANKMIDRDLSIWCMMAITWAAEASLQDNAFAPPPGLLILEYLDFLQDLVDLTLKNRKIDETHYNMTFKDVDLDLKIIAGFETPEKLVSDESNCGGDIYDFDPNWRQTSFRNDPNVAYVGCELYVLAGGFLNPRLFGSFGIAPFIFWKFLGYDKDGNCITVGCNNRRRLILNDMNIEEYEYKNDEFRRLQSSNITLNGTSPCSPNLYTIPHLDDTYKNYDTRLDATASQSRLPWPTCYAIPENANTNDGYTEASDCFVLTHDTQQTVCACQNEYFLVTISNDPYIPNFNADLGRYNPDYTWDGFMSSVGHILWFLLIAFFFTFAFYILPTYDRHKAMLAVKKALPKSERANTYYRTAEGKEYKLTRIEAERYSFCSLFIKVYQIRLRNDHLCLWWCCDDPGSNISHLIKVTLTLLYVLLFMFLIAIFYAEETEVVFSDILYAFLIAFLTILPIWCLSWCISKIRPVDFDDEEIEEIIEDQMPRIVKNQMWENEYSSADEGGDSEYDEYDFNENPFAVPEHRANAIFNDDTEIQRIYTDIDEEIEYLEDNYMPTKNDWKKKITKTLPNMYDEKEDSISKSYEERRGFESLDYLSHWNAARAATDLGFIPMNENEEIDNDRAKELLKKRKDNINDIKSKKKKKRNYDNNDYDEVSQTNSMSNTYGNSSRKKSKKKSLLTLFNKKDDEAQWQQEIADHSADNSYNDDSYDESINNNKKRKKKRKKPSIMEMQAPKPLPMMMDDEDMDEEINKKKKKKRKNRKKSAGDNIEMAHQYGELKENPQSEEEAKDMIDDEIPVETLEALNAAEFVGAHLNANRKFKQFNHILDYGRMYNKDIKKKPGLLQAMIDEQLNRGQQHFYNSKKLVKKAVKLIKNDSDLMKPNNDAVNNKNKSHIEKLRRKADIIDSVFPGMNDNEINNKKGYLGYSAQELRNLERLPNKAPSQRYQEERKTTIKDDIWDKLANNKYDDLTTNYEDKKRNKTLMHKPKDNENINNNYFDVQTTKKEGINMDDIWEITGELPPDLLLQLEDPYDAWADDELKPIQKIISPDAEDEYKRRMRNHFRKRRELLRRKYWLPRWCQYIIWLILLALIILFAVLFLFHGNKLGAQFLWVPNDFDNFDCSVSIPEKERFDYDFSVVEAERRNPACAPENHPLSMNNCWDYRVRFTISCLITFLTSIFIVQPLYIAIGVLVILLICPLFMPRIADVRRRTALAKQGEGTKRWMIGGKIMISNDTVLEYGQINDKENEYDDDDDNLDGNTKRTHVLKDDLSNDKAKPLLNE